MRGLNRRDFLRDAAALGGAVALGSAGSAAEEPRATRKGAANDQLHVAVIGVRGQGSGDLRGFAGKHDCVVTTVCDVDTAVIGPAMKAAESQQGKTPRYEQDLRKVLDDKSIDVVSIATPNHWHALAAIWALQAGKHVYVQKPVSHNVSEGRRIIEAARKYNRLCQTGTQSRSMPGMRAALDFLLAGKLGKVKLARGVCYKNRPSIGKVTGPQQPPKTMNYDLWCGPAPYKLPQRNGKNGPVHYDWHWIWDYGNGDLGNQGIHEMDKARWGLGKAELPRSVVSVGGRFGYVDDGETPNTQICVFDYGDCELIFEVRGLTSGSPYPFDKGGKKGGNFVGNVWYGTEGVLVCPSYSSGTAYTLQGEVIQKFDGKDDGAHYGNFVKAIRSGKKEDLHADIVEGHLSSALCHLGNVSYRLGQTQPLRNQAKAFGDDKEAYETLARMADHLGEHKLPVADATFQVGRKLTVDTQTETFVNDKEADTHLTRAYRKGFEVPAKV